jgi:hypothetical protein
MLIQSEQWNAVAEVREGRNEWGSIPDAKRFQHAMAGYEKPTEIHGWEFSVTFGRWSALATFADGWRGFTFPETARVAPAMGEEPAEA